MERRPGDPPTTQPASPAGRRGEPADAGDAGDPTDPTDPIARWLAAERAGGQAEAEAALAALLANLDQPAPPAGFATRVMLRAAEAGALAVQPSLVRSAWARAAVVLLVLAAGLAVTFALVALQPLVARFSPGDLVAGLAALATAAGSAAAGLVEGLQRVEVLRRAIALSLASPAVALAVGLCLALAAGGFRLLHDILQRERSWSYVDPI